MKKYFITLLLGFVIGCFASSPKVTTNVISTTESIKNRIELKVTEIKEEINMISQSYKPQTAAVKEVKIEDVNDQKIIKAGIGNFGCSPDKPEKVYIIKPMSVPQKSIEKAKPKSKVVKVKTVRKSRQSKPAIISVKQDWSLVDGRMMFTTWKVKLNKAGLDKVKMGARVRIFIDYCYYESDEIQKDGTVTFNIAWHPPLAPTKGKIGVSLFLQLNVPEIGSGIQYCSTIIKV
jgi:hypothetical protein